MIPYGRQNISEADIAEVIDALRSDFITQGPRGEAFASAVANKAGAKGGVAVNSATSALHVAALALGLKPGGLLWTTPNTFVASANAALYCGAEIDFVDIDPASRNMSPAALEEKLRSTSRAPDIIMPVHFSGRSAEMEKIGALARDVGARVIEDASHAIGGAYQNRPIGCCAWSDVTVFSFHPVKIITTGEGGCAVSNDPALVDHMRRLSSHGVTRDPRLMTRHSPTPQDWAYEQIELGFNYRMTDIQAALGLSQLDRLEAFVIRRSELAARYFRLLEPLSEHLSSPPPDDAKHRSAWHLYVVELKQPEKRDEVFARMRSAGIGVNVHYIPVHTQPFFRDRGFSEGDFPVSEKYFSGAITLPLHPDLTEQQQDTVVDALAAALAAA